VEYEKEKLMDSYHWTIRILLLSTPLSAVTAVQQNSLPLPRFKMDKGEGKRKRNSSRNSTPDTEATAPESLYPPELVHHGETSYALLNGGVKRLRISHSKDSTSHHPVHPDERTSLTSHMHSSSEHATTLVQDAQEHLDPADSLQVIYLKAGIFDAVIRDIVDVHPYVKMALGMMSRAAKMIPVQVDRDTAVLKLLDKLSEVYRFIAQDEMRGEISSMHAILGKISQQTRECARFIKNYSETKKIWSRRGKDVVQETEDTIQMYNDVFDRLMRDQVGHDVDVYVHCTEESSELSGMTYADGAGLDTRKECLQGTRTEILSQITKWVNSTGDNIPRVLWLSGPAGKGKSAIAHTIAKWFEDVGGLGSCY
jgi:hypothetical protein